MPSCHVISSPFNHAILVRVSWCAVGPAQWVLAASGPRPEHDVKLLPWHGVMAPRAERASFFCLSR